MTNKAFVDWDKDGPRQHHDIFSSYEKVNLGVRLEGQKSNRENHVVTTIDGLPPARVWQFFSVHCVILLWSLVWLISRRDFRLNSWCDKSDVLTLQKCVFWALHSVVVQIGWFCRRIRVSCIWTWRWTKLSGHFHELVATRLPLRWT